MHFGDHKRFVYEGTEQVSRIISFTVIPNYSCADGESFKEDIAVFQFEPIAFNKAIQPSSIPTKLPKEASEFWIIGYGLTSTNSTITPDVLQIGEVGFWDSFYHTGLGYSTIYSGTASGNHGDSGGTISCKFPGDTTIYLCSSNSGTIVTAEGNRQLIGPTIVEYANWIEQASYALRGRRKMTNTLYMPVTVQSLSSN